MPLNLAFLLADDHTVTAVGAYGRRLAKFAQTKHIDALAARGATFENAFCTTSLFFEVGRIWYCFSRRLYIRR